MLYLIVYLAIGACAACFRAYIDPLLLEIGVTGSYGEKKTMFYSEGVFLHFVIWPAMLLMTALTFISESFRQRGLRAKAKRVARREIEKAAEREIDRIIKEHAL